MRDRKSSSRPRRPARSTTRLAGAGAAERADEFGEIVGLAGSSRCSIASTSSVRLVRMPRSSRARAWAPSCSQRSLEEPHVDRNLRHARVGVRARGRPRGADGSLALLVAAGCCLALPATLDVGHLTVLRRRLGERVVDADGSQGRAPRHATALRCAWRRSSHRDAAAIGRRFGQEHSRRSESAHEASRSAISSVGRRVDTRVESAGCLGPPDRLSRGLHRHASSKTEGKPK